MRDVYISGSGNFMPGEPVTSDRISEHLGVFDERSEKFGRFTLRQNKIKTRHYAMNAQGEQTHSNAEMAALAIIDTIAESGIKLEDIELISAATTLGDLMVPGHGSMVHGELGGPPVEIASFQSVCASSMMAFKTAWLNVRAEEKTSAIAVGSELSSIRFRPGYYVHANERLRDKATRMSAEFLRWTMSDGAGALLLEPEPRASQPLRVDAIQIKSFANQFDPCMYAGAPFGEVAHGKKTWGSYPGGPSEAAHDGAIMLVQDMALLKDIFKIWVDEFASLIKQGWCNPEETDWLLCHYSAHSLRDEIMGLFNTAGIHIDEDKWFSNLYSKGNTGAAAMFIMIDEFRKSGRAKPGDKIICITPESGRALISFMKLTVM